MKHKHLGAIALSAALLLNAGCGIFGDEADLRDAVHAFFSAAQRGDIEAALDHVAREQPTAQLLARIKGEDEDRYKKTLAALGKKTSEKLRGAQLHIGPITVKGERAIITGLIIRPNTEEIEFTITAAKREGKWLLLTLPETEMLE